MFPGVHVRDARVALELWTMELRRNLQLHRPMKLRVVERQDQIEAEVVAGLVDVVALSTTAYLDMTQRVDLVPELAPTRDGISQEAFVVLVPAHADTARLSILSTGKVLMSALDRGQAATLWLEVLMLRAGFGKADLQSLSFDLKDRPAHAVLPVMFGQADAAIVTEASYDLMCELNPQVAADLRVAWRSPPLLTRIMCSRVSLDAETRRQMRSAALRMGETTEGRQILDLLQTGPALPFTPEMLATLKALRGERARLVRESPSGT